MVMAQRNDVNTPIGRGPNPYLSLLSQPSLSEEVAIPSTSEPLKNGGVHKITAAPVEKLVWQDLLQIFHGILEDNGEHRRLQISFHHPHLFCKNGLV